MSKKRTLKQLREDIEEQIPPLHISCTSNNFNHNIISLTLRIIARDFSKRSANKAIRDFNLEELGWRQKE